jgi:hypothetical protein
MKTYYVWRKTHPENVTDHWRLAAYLPSDLELGKGKKVAFDKLNGCPYTIYTLRARNKTEARDIAASAGLFFM